MPRVLRALLVPLLALLCATALHAQPVDALPVSVADGATSLNGSWTFRYIPGLDAGADERFVAPAFDTSAWKPIAVPGHWELQGFAEPQYADALQPGLGLYRRTFRTEKAWADQRVFLRFEGVLFGFAAFVNGKPVGEWASGFNPATFDITDALAPAGAENVLAVRVTTRSKGWDFDTMDCWSISGIYRDVTVFALPATHLQDLATRTALQPDGSAQLAIDALASGSATLTGRLRAPDGRVVQTFETALAADGRGAATVSVARPTLWTAESPSLYRLELELKSAGRILQRHATRIGLRQVTIEEGILKLNGTPIKLRGVNHHEIWPEGRVSTEANTRRDLQLMREANINFVRTSHYPPHPRLLDLCDELGLYVLDEVPFIHGRQHLTDPDFQDTLYTRARATVLRDKNHASVLFWSLGNENPINELGNNTGRYVKQLDPSRPIMFPTIGSYFAANYPKMADVQDIYAEHYPPLKRVRDHARDLRRPILFTEYAHQRGLARAGTAVQELWEEFYRSPRIAGGAIWMFQDQGLLRTAADASSVENGDLMAWLDDHRYYDTHGFFAMDGLVYSDRTPQIDYWLVRKVYSPVQIVGDALAVRPGAQTLSVSVENRHDFRSLAGFKLHWSLRQNRAELQHGTVTLSAAPRRTEPVALPVKLPATLGVDVYSLELRCEDDRGHQLYERTLRLDTGAAPGVRRTALLAALPQSEPALDITDSAIVVRRADYQLHLDRTNGHLSLVRPDGGIIVSAFGPHTGRHPTINDLGKTREREPQLWRGSLLDEVADLKTAARRLPEGIELTVDGTYPRPGKPEESVRGGYRLLATPSGAIEVSYRYAPVNATGEMLETGFALALPAAHSEFRWLGQGPYASYPGKDRHCEYGIFHLNRDDLHFPGNRRSVEFASLAAPSGTGVLLAGDGLTVDLENKDGATILSHLAAVPGGYATNEGQGEKIDMSNRLAADQLRSIEGSFTLLPLSPAWPRPLATWQGAPSERVPVLKPFLRSYDQ